MKSEDLKTGDCIRILNKRSYSTLIDTEIYEVRQVIPNISRSLTLELRGRLSNEDRGPKSFNWSCSPEDFEIVNPMDYLEPYDIIKNYQGDCSYIWENHDGLTNGLTDGHIEAEILQYQEIPNSDGPSGPTECAKQTGYKCLYSGRTTYTPKGDYTFVEKRWSIPKTDIKGDVGDKKNDFSYIPYNVGDQVVCSILGGDHLGKVVGFIKNEQAVLVEFNDTTLYFLHNGCFSHRTVYDKEGNILDLKHNEIKYYYCYSKDLRPAQKEIDTTETSKNWRFKTKQEMIEEFGESFRNKGVTWPEGMDYLFGQTYIEEVPTGENWTCISDGYTIAKWMVTDKPLPKNANTIDIENLPTGTYVESTGMSGCLPKLGKTYQMGIDPIEVPLPPDREVSIEQSDQFLAVALRPFSTEDCIKVEKDTPDNLVDELSYFDTVKPLQESDLLDFE